jgi:hypothetical protein
MQCFRNLLEDFRGWFVEAAFDLTQVGIGNLGEIRKLAQREICELTLGADEFAEAFEMIAIVHASTADSLRT